MSNAPHETVTHDKHFYDSFMVVLGLLILVAILLGLLARFIGLHTQASSVLEDESVALATSERLAPVGKVAISGQDNSALEPPKPQQTAAAAADMSGEQAYSTACTACHGAGIAGAPKYGDKAAWSARIAQGMPTLYKHAIEGFQGQAGFMPAKGGRMDLSDKSVTNAVDYIVAGSK